MKQPFQACLATNPCTRCGNLVRPGSSPLGALAHRLAIALLLLCSPLATATERVKVGVYNYAPLVFVDTQGRARGLFVDALELVAEREAWELEFVPGSWQENLNRLESGEIDLLVNIAETEERRTKFDFSRAHLFLDWGMVYRRKGAQIETIFDLRDRKIAVLKGAFYTGEFKKLLELFAVEAQLVEKAEFSAVLKAIAAGEVDAGVNANLAGLELDDASLIERTGIVFAPTRLRFAIRKGRNAELLQRLDLRLAELQGDKGSAIHGLPQKWLGLPGHRSAMPTWAVWVLAGLAVGVALLFAMSLLLRKQVARRTAELRESEEGLAITLQSIGDAVIATNAAGRVTRMNPAAERLSGWTLADAAGRPLSEVFRIFNAETRDPLPDPAQIVMARGQVVGLANYTVLQARDGAEYLIADCAAPIRNAEGKILGVVLVFSDVTAQYRAQDALRRSEARFRGYFNLPLIGLAITSPEKGWMEVNERLCDILGYRRDEIVRLTWQELTHPEDISREVAQFERVLAGEIDSYSLDKRFMRKNGSVMHAAMSVCCVREENGSVGYFVAVIDDITERMRMEEALRESECRWKFAIEGSGDGMWDWNFADGTLFFSGRWKEMLGYSGNDAGELPGPWETLLHPEDRERTLATLRDYLEGRTKSYASEHRIRCADASYKWVLDRGMVVGRGEEGEPLRMIGTQADLSERKRLEEVHLQAQNLESLGTLAGGIAHDFNNILAAIRGNSDLAAETLRSDPLAAECLAEIGKATSRASELVRRIMAFGRPREARQEVVDLGEVTAEVMKLLRATLPAGISLRTGFAVNAPHALADAGQVHEAIVNLTTNAAHAIGSRTGVVEFRLKSVQVSERLASHVPGLRTGRHACLTVTDDGVGMDAATAKRIFDAFFTTKSVGKGSGLGLSIVHGIMRSHGGAVTVESTPGKGSTFALYFPAARGKAAPEKVRVPEPVRQGPGKRILYVDDESGLVRLACNFLSRRGHTIVGYDDPREALDHFRGHGHEYDAVVTDLSMPHMSGFELAREILVIRPELPVLMLTGFASGEDEVRAREIGIHELILKPVSMQELCDVLDNLLRRVGTGETPATSLRSRDQPDANATGPAALTEAG